MCNHSTPTDTTSSNYNNVDIRQTRISFFFFFKIMIDAVSIHSVYGFTCTLYIEHKLCVHFVSLCTLYTFLNKGARCYVCICAWGIIEGSIIFTYTYIRFHVPPVRTTYGYNRRRFGHNIDHTIL